MTYGDGELATGEIPTGEVPTGTGEIDLAWNKMIAEDFPDWDPADQPEFPEWEPESDIPED